MTRPHWLTVAPKPWTPGVVVSFDTETQPVARQGQEVLTLRCWDALVRQRSGDPDVQDATWPWDGESAGDLASVLEAAVSIQGEAWAFAHNAGFDLTVTSLPMVLAERGWQPAFVNIGEETCVFIMESPAGKLVITDSWSWLRCGLEQAAKDIGKRKVRLPDDDDSLEAWHHRCRHDVEILDELLVQLLDWWDHAGVGKFSVTGSACGWQTFRSRIEPKTILVGPEYPRTDLERSAIFGGRKEVWQVGRTRGRWVEDWDLATAHLQTVARFPMPVAPVGPAAFPAPPSPVSPPPGFGAVCRVEITTGVPCAPVRVLEDVWWPVGTFRTVVTTPELAEVMKHASSVRMLESQWYRLGDACQSWGQWCLGLQSESDSDVPRVVKRVAKGWGRAVPGRFALRTSELIGERSATHLGWALETGHDLDTGAALETITYGGVERTYRKDQDGTDISPVVLAFVEGYVRAAMSKTIAARNPGDILQCNTDGWWEIRAGKGSLSASDAVPGPYTAVRKAVSRDVTVMGPNHLETSKERRLAGIPERARPRLDGGFAWEDWPGLRWQLQYSRPGEYIRPGRQALLEDHYCRRWVLTTGETVPVSCRVTPSGETSLLPWSQADGRRQGDELAEWQVKQLQPLADVATPWESSPLSSPPWLPGRRTPLQTAA